MIRSAVRKKPGLAVLDALRNRRGLAASPHQTKKVFSRTEKVTALPGAEEKNQFGSFLRWERRLDLNLDWLSELNQNRHDLWPQEQNALEKLPTLKAHDFLFFDLETCGFSGTPLFLVGCLILRGGEGRLVQLLARHYGEEAAVVSAARDLMGRHSLWVSFNGKSYDAPFLADRCRLFGLEPATPLGHLDLLHASRRRWKHELPNCRLGTLERQVLGLERPPDTPGSQVPAQYHEFVKKGELGKMISILRHNAQDLKSLALLMGALPRHKRKPLTKGNPRQGLTPNPL